MRILFLNHNVAWSGGTFFRAFHFARHLAGRSHDVTLLTVAASNRIRFRTERREGVRVVHTPDLLWGVGRTGWDAWDTLRRCGWVAGGTWDIIHAWDSRPVAILPALWALRRAGLAPPSLVMDWCDWWGRGGTQAERSRPWMKPIAPIETWFEEHFRTRAQGTTVISRALLQRAQALGVPAASIRLLPQGCDADLPPGDRASARQRLGLDPDAKVLLSIGALQKADAALLFETLPLLFARCPDCRFFLIGRHGATVPPDIAARPQFTETGYLPAQQLQDYTEACDGLLVALGDTVASRGRWPSKVNPLLAAGRAVCISRVGDLPALLEQHEAGVVAAADAGALADAAARLLTDAGLREGCECRARELARTRLAWPRLAAELDGFYAEVRDQSRLSEVRA